MRKRTIALLIVWGSRVIMYCVLIYAMYDFGTGIDPSILGATMFIVFWIWYFYIDDVDNPVIRYDENV